MLTFTVRYSDWDYFEGYQNANHKYYDNQWYFLYMHSETIDSSAKLALWYILRWISQSDLSSDTHSIAEFVFYKEDVITETVTVALDNKLLDVEQTIQEVRRICKEQILLSEEEEEEEEPTKESADEYH